MSPIPFQAVRHAAPGAAGPGRLLPPGDARWVLAARAALAASPSGRVSAETRSNLIASAVRAGFTPIHARAVVTIAEQAAARGGLDREAAEQLSVLPVPTAPGAGRAPALVCVVLPALAVVALLVTRWW